MDNIKERKYGALISKPDERDYIASSYLPVSAQVFPESFKVHNIPDVVYNQYITSKCVAYSLKQIIESFNMFEQDKYIPVSVDFIFSNRYPDQDTRWLMPFEGAYPRDLINNLALDGVPEDLYCPTKQPDDFNDFVNITQVMRDNAIKYKIATYLKITTDDELKTALMNLGAVTASIPITDKFIGGYNEMITTDYAQSHLRGNHMITICGWEKHNGIDYWICKNSWGAEWGDYKGWFYLPFGYYCNEIWAITDKTLNHWASKYFDYLTGLGIAITEKGFDIPATRGKCFEFFSKALGYKGIGDNDAYWNYINTKMKIYEKRYEDKITRAEMFVILAKYKGSGELTVPKGQHWSQPYFNYLNANGLKIFDTRFDDTITRGDCLALISRLLGYIDK